MLVPACWPQLAGQPQAPTWICCSGVCRTGLLLYVPYPYLVCHLATSPRLPNIQDLGSQRPFFMPPVLGKARVERPFTEKRQQQVVQQHVWTLDDSIFAQRKKENEARDLFDTEKVRHSGNLQTSAS